VRIAGLLALAALLVPAPAAAGDEPGGAQLPPPRNPPPDFFFGRPSVSIGVRGGWVFARAGSDWFDFVTDQLTLEKGDFQTANIAGDVGISIARRFELEFGADYGSTSSDSEFRNFVDNSRFPIDQTTDMKQAAFTAGLRFTLTERGRELSSLAWIPRRLVPYVGGGGGALWYKVHQYGEFVDFQTFAIFRDSLESSGFTPALYAHGGFDLHLVSHVYLAVDARYLWAAPELGSEWREFEPLDLTSLRLSTGINVLF
jgi:hypothetical protein